MALTAALVDRARRIRPTPLASRVEGTTKHTTLTSPWFKARLTFEHAPEALDTSSSRKRTRREPTLLLGVKDENGDVIDLAYLSGSDRIEVDSRQLGRAVYEVIGDPEPLRKKRRLLGWQARLVRVDEDPFQRP